jgi:hypothetical protein
VEPVDLFNSKAATAAAAAAAADDTMVNVALQATAVVPLLLLSLAPHQVRLASVCAPWVDVLTPPTLLWRPNVGAVQRVLTKPPTVTRTPPTQAIRRTSGCEPIWLALCLLNPRRRT